MKFIILIPLFNEENNIDIIVENLNKSVLLNKDYKILFIDDGSIDNTWDKINKISKKYNKVCGIKLKKNIGKDKALMQGVNLAIRKSFEFVIMIDGDLQHPLEKIDKLVKIHSSENLSIIGRRTVTKLSFIRKLFSKVFFLFLTFFTLKKIRNNLSDFCLIKKSDLEAYMKFDDKRFNCILFSSQMKNIKFFEFETIERKHGDSKFNFISLLKLGLKIYIKVIKWSLLFLYLFSSLVIKFFSKSLIINIFFYFLIMVFLVLIFLKVILTIRSKSINFEEIIEEEIFQ